jgi:hypothetical protein
MAKSRTGVEERVMRSVTIVLVVLLVLGALTACGGGAETSSTADDGEGTSHVSTVLDQSYPDALDVPTQMVLGTLRLEGTAEAVTAEQAADLLPLWQALRGGITVEAEVDAVLKQIEMEMTEEQLEAIAAMQLTQEDLQAWMAEQGPGAGAGFPGRGEGDQISPEVQATRQAQSGDREISPEMATRRAEFENMSEEERAAIRATMEAGGGFPGGAGGVRGSGAPGGTAGGSGMSFRFLLGPLVQMLEVRAGEA